MNHPIRLGSNADIGLLKKVTPSIINVAGRGMATDGIFVQASTCRLPRGGPRIGNILTSQAGEPVG